MRLTELLGLATFCEPQPETISLDGPFLAEEQLFRHREKYINLIVANRSNLVISRDLLILSSDNGFPPGDNVRIKAGLNHHIHNFELAYNNAHDYRVVAIDQFILLNPLDAKALKDYTDHHLPTNQELKNLYMQPYV